MKSSIKLLRDEEDRLRAEMLMKDATMEAEAAALRGIDYRNAMAHLAASVNIVTSDGAGGQVGFSATAVCSVSDNPPTLLVCLNRSSSAHGAVTANGVLCVNILSSEQQELASLFGGKTPMAERFAAGRWTALTTGSPVLEGALVSFDCRIRIIHDGGTHDILICDVIEMTKGRDGDALVYFRRAFRHL